MMTITNEELFARFKVLEFIVMNMLTVQLAAVSDEESKHFKLQVLAALKAPGGDGVAANSAVLEQIEQLAEKFLRKVSEGEVRYRASAPDQKAGPQ